MVIVYGINGTKYHYTDVIGRVSEFGDFIIIKCKSFTTGNVFVTKHYKSNITGYSEDVKSVK